MEPIYLFSYGTVEEIMEDFDLGRKEVEESLRFVQEQGKKEE